MDQAVLAGVGNVYRAEVLFRHGLHPLRPGATLRVGQWRAIWDDLVDLMGEGVVANRIDTVRPEHTPEAMGREPARRRPRRRGLRLPPHRPALPGVRLHRAHRGAGRTQCVLVCAMSAPVPLPGRTVLATPRARTEHMSTTRSGGPSLGRRFEDWLLRVLPSETRTLVVLVVLTVALGLAIWQLPDWSPTHRPDPADGGGQPRARAAPAAVVRGVRAAHAGRPGPPAAGHHRAHRRDGAGGLLRSASSSCSSSFRRSRLGVAGLRGESMLVDLRDRILKQGRIPDAAGRLARRQRAALGRRHGLRRRLRGRGPPRRPARRRRRRRLRQGRGRRHPGPAALRCARWPAAGAPAGGLPRRGQRLPPRPGLGRGLRLGRPPLARPRRPATTPIRSAGHPPAALRAAGSGRWSVLEAEGPRPGPHRGDDVRRRRGRP